MFWKVLVIISSLIVFIAMSWESGAGVSVGDNDDELLAKKLREAVEKKVAIEAIEEFVGKKAVINTIRKEDKDLLRRRRVDIEVEPKESQLDSLKSTKHFVYWMQRGLKSDNPKIIGVAWTEKDEMKMFYGVVLPPT